MPPNNKRKRDELPDLGHTSAPTLHSGTVAAARAPASKSTATALRPGWWNKPDDKLSKSQKNKKEKILKKEALMRLSCLHPLAEIPQRVPLSKVRPTDYPTPTPVVPNETHEYVVTGGKVKVKSERAPPPPPANQKHFAVRKPGQKIHKLENKLLNLWADRRIRDCHANAEVIEVEVDRAALAARERSASNLDDAEAKVREMQENPELYKPIYTSTFVTDSSRNREPLAFYFASDPKAFDEKKAELLEKCRTVTDEEVDALVRDLPNSYHGMHPRALLHFVERAQDIVALYTPPVKDPDNSSRHRASGLDKDAESDAPGVNVNMRSEASKGTTDADPISDSDTGTDVDDATPDSTDDDSDDNCDKKGKCKKNKKKKKASKKKRTSKKKGDAITEEEKTWADLVHKYSYAEYSIEEATCREVFSTAAQLGAVVDRGIDPPEELFTKFKESIGVLHFVHCWHENGKRSLDDMCSSSDMRGDGGGTRQGAARAYHVSTRFVRCWIDRCFKSCVPARDYKAYAQTYRAGRNLGKDIPGPFLAQVVIWKCDSRTHRDSNDGHGAWCVTFCGGNFEGGVIYFPDLGLCFRYKPGDILIFRSADLYHCVGPWTPKAMKASDTITPGRVAFVFFSPANSMRVLKGKRDDWFADTAGGYYDQVSDVLPRKKRRTQ